MVHQTHHLIYQHICAPLHSTKHCIKKVKQERWKIIIKEQKYFHDGDVQSKTTISKEIALLSKMQQDDESLDLGTGFLFFFSHKKETGKSTYKNHTKQGTEDITDIHSHPSEKLSQHSHTHSTQTTHNSPYKPKMCCLRKFCIWCVKYA